MQPEKSYIIEGGAEGKKRLDVLSDVLKEHTQKLIELDGNIEGKTFLDMGTGGGNLARMVAQMVGNEGHVTAIDFDETIVDLARQQAADENITNITFHAQNAYDIQYDNEFDIVYARFLLSHLTEPARLVQKMITALKPGGRLLIEDIDFSGHYCYPASRDFELYLQYFTTASQNNGQNPDMGLSLFKLLKDAVLTNVQYDVIQPTFNKGQGKWMAYYTMDRIKHTILQQGLASEEAIKTILHNLEQFTNDENTIISMPRIFRVWGYKTV